MAKFPRKWPSAQLAGKSARGSVFDEVDRVAVECSERSLVRSSHVRSFSDFLTSCIGNYPPRLAENLFTNRVPKVLSSILVIVFVRVCTDHGQVKLTNSSAGR